MIDWIKNEYERFCNSRTVKLAYAQKAMAVVTFILAMLPATQSVMTPLTYSLLFALFGYISKQLRLATSTRLE